MATSVTLIANFITHLKLLIQKAQAYGFPNINQDIERLDFYESQQYGFVLDTGEKIKDYHTILKTKDYNFFDNKVVDFGEVELNKFVLNKWATMTLEDKRYCFRQLSHMYNSYLGLIRQKK